MVSSRWHYGVLDGHGVTLEVIYGGKGTILSAVRLCGMGIILNLALDMCRSIHLTIL